MSMTKVAAMPKEEIWKHLNAELGAEFDHYVLVHPEVLDQIPDEAALCFQLEGEEAFNRWSRRLATRTGGQPIVYVHITKLKPIQSRIAAVEITLS